MLERRSQTENEKFFEVALCRECGQHYFVGRIRGAVLEEAIRDPSDLDFGVTFLWPIEGRYLETDEEQRAEPTRDRFRLCLHCGLLQAGGRLAFDCGHDTWIEVEKQDQKEDREDQLPACGACGYRGQDPVREVIHGTDGPHVVIATTLYQYLPHNRRKVLAFADSRQEAAFFAWYLEHSYGDIFHRQSILRAVHELSSYAQAGLSLTDLADPLRKLFPEQNIFPAATSDLTLLKRIWIQLYREFLTDEHRISLEGVGLAQWNVKWPEDFIVPEILLAPPWSLSRKESLEPIFVLLSSLRLDKAVDVRVPPGVLLAWADLRLQGSQTRATTISGEDVLSFLSRKAVIPKYGFPVDVVELDPHRNKRDPASSEVSLERDLSLAISEFAPTSRIIANKKEWISYGVKRVAEKEWPRKEYRRCRRHNLLLSWNPGEEAPSSSCCGDTSEGIYIIPQFGFVTNRDKPGEPSGRAARVFSTRPYFLSLTGQETVEIDFGPFRITKTSPGRMAILCEGRRGSGFYLCRTCGAGFRKPERTHHDPYGQACQGTLEQVALGHEFETDVMQMRFAHSQANGPLEPIWLAYSVALAIVEGAADLLEFTL